MSKLREFTDVPRRIYAIGDIHGCLEELNSMLDHLVNDQRIGEEDLVIFIGDYIDRGKNSKEVIARLLKFQSDYPRTVFLRGNHEDMLLDYIGPQVGMGGAYIANGGYETVKSYGLPPTSSAQEFLDALPPAHLSFFLNLDSYVSVGDFIFVHAGLSPRRPLDAQIDHDLFWIRDEFIFNVHGFEKTVIFGHTPYQAVMFHWPYKVGIDTGLVYGNMLSCLELMQRQIFQIDRGGKEIRTSAFPDPDALANQAAQDLAKK